MRPTPLLIATGILAIFLNSCATRPDDPAAVDRIDPVAAPRPADGPLGTNTDRPTPTTLPTYRSE